MSADRINNTLMSRMLFVSFDLNKDIKRGF